MKRLLLTAAVLAGPVWVGSKAVSKDFEPLESKEARFSAEVPSSWQQVAPDRRPHIYEVVLRAPDEGGGPPMTLEVEYYAPGNALFADDEAFLVQQSAPAEPRAKGRAKFKGRLMGKPQPIKVGKAKGKHWFRESEAKDAPARMEFVLLDAAKGFYVLTYTAPKNRFLKNRKAFQRLLDSFQPAL